MFAMNLALMANNIGLMWVAVELATLTTVMMVGIYRTARGDRGGVEILHPGQRRHRAGAVRHDPGLSGRPAGGRRGARRDGLDRRWSPRPPQLRPGAAQPRLRLPAARLRHQGRAGAAARLAAGRPCRGPDADFGRAVRACCSTSRSMRCCGSRCCWRPTRQRIAPGPLMMTLGLVSLIFAAFMLYRRRDIKRLFAYSSIEHMGIIAFAFGMGGPLGEFRRAAAHDHAQPDQIGDLLRRRPHRAGQGHAADRRHPRPDGQPSGARLGAWCSASSPSPACRRSACSRASSWWSARPSPASRCWRCRWCSACWSRSARCCCGCSERGLWRAARAGGAGRRRPMCRCSRIWRWCWSPASICRRRWSPGSSTSRRCCG